MAQRPFAQHPSWNAHKNGSGCMRRRQDVELRVFRCDCRLDLEPICMRTSCCTAQPRLCYQPRLNLSWLFWHQCAHCAGGQAVPYACLAVVSKRRALMPSSCCKWFVLGPYFQHWIVGRPPRKASSGGKRAATIEKAGPRRWGRFQVRQSLS